MTMARSVALAALCATLGGCAAAGGLSTPHAELERAENTAELAYQAGVPFYTPAQKDKAWADLMAVRKLYEAGQPIAAAVAKVTADSNAAKGAK